MHCRYSFAICALLYAVAPASAEPRSAVDLDGAWAFRLDPENAGEREQWFGPSVAFVDAIQVPGAWDAQGFGGETEKLRHQFIGKAWYKRQVDIPPNWTDRRVFLRLGGVHRYASVWVNGVFLGEHVGYLSPFEFDITEYAVPGASVLVAVRVDSEQRWDIDTLTGCFDIIDYMDTYWGGIWGHVDLEGRSAVYLEDLFVEPGVDPARCRVSATVKGVPPANATLRLDILDRDGGIVAETTEIGTVSLAVETPEARLWTPDDPNLYVARLSLVDGGAVLDTVETRFGFREIRIENAHILLNGAPIFLRGYGDDAVYPETMAAPSDEAVYRKKVALAKSYGFNHVRHHSHMLPPEYYDVCDELGLLVSAEFPIAYQQFYARATDAALDLYRTEWSAAIRRLRNHPSVFDWCMGNEMYERVPLAPDLYRIAKELDSTRPVVDSDGLPPSGFTEGTRDRDTLDLYFTQFDVFNTPLENAECYRCPAPRKPVVSHETGNYVTFPRLDQIDLFKDNFKPFWLDVAREKVERMGLLDETPRWAENTERLYALLRKIDIETLRKIPNLSGYHWWLFQDYWTTSNGIVDTYLRVKPCIGSDYVRAFNSDVILLEDGLDLVYGGGERLQITFLLSNFGPSDVAGSTVSFTVLQGENVVAGESRGAPPVLRGAVKELTAIDVPLPEVEAPARIVIKAQLNAGGSNVANEWFTWVYPTHPAAVGANVPLFASSELLPWCATGHAALPVAPLPQTTPYPSEAVYFANALTPELLDAVVSGASLVLCKPLGVFPAAITRFKTAWWLGSPDDNNAGTVVYDHPATCAMAPDGWCDTSWYRLIEGCDGYLLDEFPAQPAVTIRGVEVACVCRNKSMLFEAKVGAGCLIVCGLNLEATREDGTPCPVAKWLTLRLAEYAATLPDQASALPESFLRERAVETPRFAPPFVEGFARILRSEGETSSWFTYRKNRDHTEVVRQTELGRVLEWETAPVPESISGDGVTFVFAGGLGWMSQPTTDGFVLQIEGNDALRLDVVRGRGLWRDDSNRVTLGLVPRRMTSEDTAGLFYLAVPGDLVAPGRPCRLAVKSLGSGSQRWFALHPYSDVLGAGPAPATP